MFDYKGSFIIEYTIKAITGLRVGGSKEQFEIGGLDNPVIKVEVEIPDYDGKGNTLPQGAPYIPGSSIKGKMRSLLEWANGNVSQKFTEHKEEIEKTEKEVIQLRNEINKLQKLKETNQTEINKKIKDLEKQITEKISSLVNKLGTVCECGTCKICKLFGIGKIEITTKLLPLEIPGPPRLKVFDAYPTWETIERLKRTLGENIFTEIKTENQINRLTSRANPRKIERVPAGAEFEGKIVFDVYRDKDKDLIGLVFQGMKMLEDSYLGGYGSRGSGRVKFTNITIKWRPKEFYLGKGSETTITEKASDPDKAWEELKNKIPF